MELVPIKYINTAIPTEVSDNHFHICIPEEQYQIMRSHFGVYIPANMPLIVLPSVGKYELRYPRRIYQEVGLTIGIGT